MALGCGGRKCAYYYNDIDGVAVGDLLKSPKFPGAPDVVSEVSSDGFETEKGFGTNYGVVVEGIVVAEESGEYTFTASSAGDTEVWVSASPHGVGGKMVKVVERAYQPGSVFPRWGSRDCPAGSTLLYEGFMASSRHDHNGGGYNFLCMHNTPQYPAGHNNGDQNGNLLYGTEYQNTGAIDQHHDKDAACSMCMWHTSREAKGRGWVRCAFPAAW